jgi:uncharacterized protein (TIGR02217 family)
MSFIDHRLPGSVERGATRLDEEEIEIVTTDGRWEVRNARHAQSLLEFTISFTDGKLKTDPVIQAVRHLFKVARGSLHSFRFKDWTEYQLENELIGTGDGSTTTFQLKRSWTLDGETAEKIITRPCLAPAPIITKNGVVQTSGYSINYDTGVVTFSSAPANGHAILATLEYDVPVRFDVALASTMAQFTAERLDSVVLVEVRE